MSLIKQNQYFNNYNLNLNSTYTLITWSQKINFILLNKYYNFKLRIIIILFMFYYCYLDHVLINFGENYRKSKMQFFN